MRRFRRIPWFVLQLALLVVVADRYPIGYSDVLHAGHFEPIARRLDRRFVRRSLGWGLLVQVHQ